MIKEEGDLTFTNCRPSPEDVEAVRKLKEWEECSKHASNVIVRDD